LLFQVLKHRQGKNHRGRIVVFVGSPVDADEKDMIRVAKKLKKDKVNVDIVSFGEDEVKNLLCSYHKL
jgi:26S proteasome regulatory subunit N10